MSRTTLFQKITKLLGTRPDAELCSVALAFIIVVGLTAVSAMAR
jgi:hypothetical protein